MGRNGNTTARVVHSCRALLGALLVVVGLGCAPGSDRAGFAGPTERPGARLLVVASTSVLADLAGQVAGPDVEVRSLVPLGGDPHIHEPTPADARTIAEADLLVGNGAGLEPWFTTLVRNQGRSALMIVDRLGLTAVFDEEGVPDPHLWMVPTIAAQYAQVIAEELARIDPGRADGYLAASARTYAEFARLDAELRERLSVIAPGRRVIVTTHDAYSYFAAHYGFEVATIIGVSTDEEPSAARMRQLISKVRDADIPTVFVETSVNPALMRRLAQDAGVRLGAPLHGDSLGPLGSGAEDYASMMRSNVAALVEGLG